MKKPIKLLFFIVIAFAFYILYSYPNIDAVTKGEKIADYQDPQKALLVIDLQRDITEKNGRAVMDLEQTDQIIAHVNIILADNKKLNFIIIYITQEFENNFILKLLTNSARQHGDHGSEIDPRVNIISNKHFVKNISDSFSNPDLDKFLIQNRVNHLYLTGVDAENSIDKTVKGALNRNYKVTVIQDAIGSTTVEKRDNKILEFTKLGLKIISTEQVLKGN